MKKIVICMMGLLLLAGCTTSPINQEKKVYNDLINEIKENNSYTKDYPFDINVYLERLDSSEITYRVIVDNPKEAINNIQAIIIHNIKTKDVYPTSGIFDDKLSLIPDKIDMDRNMVKGIILVGYIPFDKDINLLKAKFKVLVVYTDNSNIKHKVFYKYQK